MNIKQQKSKKFRRGSILGAVVVIGLCLAILGFGMLHMGFGSRVNSAISVSRINAREAADAGFRYALHSMNAAFPNTNWAPTGSAVLPNSNASYSYEITIPPYAVQQAGGYYDHYQIRSTGTSDRGQRIVYAITDVRNLFDYGLIVTDSIKLLNNNLVDGYNTTLGDYTVTNSHGYIRIGTTSIADKAIWLGQDTVITGDVLAGIGGDVYEVITNPSGDADTGPWYNLPEPWEFEPIDINVPAAIPSSGNITQANYVGPSITLGTPNTHTYLRYNNIDVPNGDSLIFVGYVEIHITGDLDLKNDAALYVGDPLDPTVPARVEIFLDGDLGVANGALINNLSRIPARFKLFGTGPPPQNWVISSSGNYYGVYYGPNADIHTHSAAQFYGSVSGHEFVLNSSGAALHYDASLAGEHEYDVGFGIDRWWEE